jgi:hypothetical protein
MVAMYDQKVNVGGLQNPDEVDDFLYALNEAAVLGDEELQGKWYGSVGASVGVASGDPEVFTSPINVTDVPTIRVPPSVLSLCNAIQEQRRNLEFSILLKGNWTHDGFVVNGDDYIIPMQTVTVASVDYDADEISRLMSEGYNCVLHSHPMNMKTFSRSDEDTINVNFDASILYCRGELCDARVCISVVPRLKLRLPAVVEWLPMTGAIRGLDKITEPPVSAKYTRRSYKWRYDDDVDEFGYRTYNWPLRKTDKNKRRKETKR